MPNDDLETANAPADGGWSFDEGVAAAFDDMLERSIPDYQNMRKFVTDAAVYFARASPVQSPTIVDLGASRGSGLAPIVDQLGVRAQYLACDVSEPMLDALRERFKSWIESGSMEVRNHDLRESVPTPRGYPAVVLSVLTLQFVPIEYRPAILSEIYDTLPSGGAFILVEKVMGGTGATDRLLTKLYYDLKAENGYTQEAIERKRLSLEGVLVPLTAHFNEELLRGAGFADPECFWRWGNFAGWVAVKR